MNEKIKFAERLKQAMQNAGYEPRPGILEKEFNTRYWGRAVTFQAVSRWLKGLSIPEQDKLQVLAEWLKIEPQALRFGEDAVQALRENRQRWEDAIAGAEREVFEAFLSLPVAQRKVLREVILTFAQAYAPTPKSGA